MVVFLLQFAASAVLAIVVAYFLLLTSTPHSTGGASGSSVSKAASSGGSGAARCSSRRSGGDTDDDGSADDDGDSVRWLWLLQRWLSGAVLGGGTGDRRLWNDRLASTLDAILRRCGHQLQQRDRLLPHLPLLRLERLHLGPPPLSCPPSLSSLRHSRSVSDVPVAAATAAIGSATSTNLLSAGGGSTSGLGQPAGSGSSASSNPLERGFGTTMPTLDSIASWETLATVAPGGIATREFRFELSYVDSQFVLLLSGEVPVLFGLPKMLHIPPDLLTLKCRVDVRSLSFRAVVWLRMRGCRFELFLDEPANFDADIAVFPPSAPSRRPPTPSEMKAGSLVTLGIRKALKPLVFPNVLVCNLHAEAPILRWRRERLESDAA